MIEVEKKFQPTAEQLTALLKDAEFLGEKNNHDIYYDYSDYRLYKNYTYLRNRNGGFELKVGEEGADDDQGTVYRELNTEEDIKKYFNADKSIEEFAKAELAVVADFSTKRKKYKIDQFTIDVDELSFGFKCVEIELLVAEKSKVASAKQEIVALAQRYGFELKDIPSKRREYFRVVKPELYKELYPN